jgi:cytochrome P450
VIDPGGDPGAARGAATTSHERRFRDDPHLVYDALRADGRALVPDPEYHRSIVTRYDVARSLLRDKRFGVDARRAVDGSYVRRIAGTGVVEGRGHNVYEPPLVLLDDPGHRRIRTLVGRAFNARTVEAQRPRVTRIVHELYDAVADRDRVDFVAEVAGPLPARVIAEMLGLDDADPVEVKRWSEDILWGYDPERDADRQRRLREAYEAATTTVRSTVAARRRAPRGDLISAMVRSRDDDDRLSDLEIVSLCIQLMVAGNVTTSDMIGNGVFHLLTRRDQWERIVARPELVDGAVEELLRFDCPITETARIAYEPVDVDGCPVVTGDVLTLSLSAANHDPAVFAEPHVLDVERDADGHLAFGSGIHVCLGAPLARMEVQLAIGELARRHPGAQVASDRPPRRHLPFFRGFESLPVELA